MNLLFWKTKAFLWKEQIFTIFRFYRSPRYLLADALFGLIWFFSNPFRICRLYHQNNQKDPMPLYGETPLRVWIEIVKRAKIQKEDLFIDLGCGRGKLTLWTALWIGCQTIGVDAVPSFIQRARRVTQLLRIKHLFYYQSSILSFPLANASVIYLFTLHPDEEMLDLSSLRKDVRLISVSERLLSKDLFVKDSFMAQFPWGKAQIFIHGIHK